MSAPRQIPLAFAYDAAMGANDFLVAECNRDAAAWIDAWPRWPSPLLILYGPTGSGKSHLARVWRDRSGAPLWPARALRARDLRGRIGEGRWVAIECDGAAGLEPEAEEALFHLYNLVRERDGGILLTAPSPPRTWRVGLADLRSRIAAAPAVGIGRPDDALLGALLVKLFADRQIEIESGLVTFLLARMERSFAAALDLVERLDRASLAERRRVTVPLARRVLEDGTGTGLDISGPLRDRSSDPYPEKGRE